MIVLDRQHWRDEPNIRRPDISSALSVHTATPETFVCLEASVLQPALEKWKPKKDRYLWGMWWRAKYFVLPLHSLDIISCTSLPIRIRAGRHISALSHARLECNRVLLLKYVQCSASFSWITYKDGRHEDGWKNKKIRNNPADEEEIHWMEGAAVSGGNLFPHQCVFPRQGPCLVQAH